MHLTALIHITEKPFALYDDVLHGNKAQVISHVVRIHQKHIHHNPKHIIMSRVRHPLVHKCTA